MTGRLVKVSGSLRDVGKRIARPRPNAANTGVPTSTTLTSWSGSTTFSTPGQVIADRLFVISTSGGQINVTAPNVVFRRCRFSVTAPAQGSPGVFYPIRVDNSPVGAVTSFYDCDFFGNGVAYTAPGPVANGTYNGFAPAAAILTKDIANGYRVVRCHISGMSDGLQLAGRNITVDSCYIHDLRMFYTGPSISHNDGMQASNMGAANVRLINNHVDGTTGHSCMQILAAGPDQGYQRHQEHFLIDGNYFNGGGYTLSGYSNEAHAQWNVQIRNFVIRNNRFGLDCTFGPSYPDRDSRIVWQNNRWDATGMSGTANGPVSVTADQLIP